MGVNSIYGDFCLPNLPFLRDPFRRRGTRADPVRFPHAPTLGESDDLRANKGPPQKMEK